MGNATLRPLNPRNYRFGTRLVGRQCRCGRMGKISLRAGFDPRTVQPIASRHTDSTIRPFASDRVHSRACLDAAGKRNLCSYRQSTNNWKWSAGRNESRPRVISSFGREEAENCALLGCYVIINTSCVITQKSAVLSCYHVWFM